MSSDSENFERLRKLISLKKHEQPPPGYFNNFSGEVISQIRAAQQGGRDITDVLAPVPWLLRLFNALETKPVFAGAFGVGICALLITGIVYSEQVPPAAPMNLVPPSLSGSLASVNPEPMTGRIPTMDPDSPQAQAQALFQQIQVQSATPTSFGGGLEGLPAGPITNGFSMPNF